MNPQNHPAQPPPAPQPQNVGTLTTDIVNNIPMQTQAGATPVKGDDDLDKIMQDVGDELKKDDNKPSKRGFFAKKKHTDVRAQPAAHAQPHQPQPAPSHPAQPAAQPPVAPKDKNPAPVLIITMTLAVTSLLIAAAYYAYK